VRDLDVERIGHGVMAVSDPALVKDLAGRQIMLEVCPGSNVALGVAQSWKTHPIETLRAAGVRVCVSTDDPPFFHTTLRDEYINLNKTFGWDRDVFLAVNLDAARAAFCDAQTRDTLIKKLETSYG
jgi:adenosine deaminase